MFADPAASSGSGRPDRPAVGRTEQSCLGVEKAAMAKKKGSAGKGAAKQEAKDLKKRKQEDKASKAAKKKSGKVSQKPNAKHCHVS